MISFGKLNLACVCGATPNYMSFDFNSGSLAPHLWSEQDGEAGGLREFYRENGGLGGMCGSFHVLSSQEVLKHVAPSFHPLFSVGYVIYVDMFVTICHWHPWYDNVALDSV